jgi:hypothetical protein
VRNVVWLVLLFVVAVVTALTLGDNAGMASFYWEGWRVDFSLNFFILTALATGFALMTAVQAVNALINLPARAREWRSLRLERAAQAALREALAESFAGRYARAHKAAQRAIATGRKLFENYNVTYFEDPVSDQNLAEMREVTAALHDQDIVAGEKCYTRWQIKDLIADLGSGLHRLVPAIRTNTPGSFPRKLSETGLFSATRDHQVQPGVVAYNLVAPAWADGASVDRFLGLPQRANRQVEHMLGAEATNAPVERNGGDCPGVSAHLKSPVSSNGGVSTQRQRMTTP